MPRPKRSKVTPSAPAQLPESLMKAIRADAASKREATESVVRRSSVRQASKANLQDAFMSGALGVRNASPSQAIVASANKDTQGVVHAEMAESEEREMVPSSIGSQEAQAVEFPLSTAIPSTAQRPIPQTTAMFSGNRRTQATPRFDSSLLGNFKRRPRKPSILGIGREDDSSTLADLVVGDSDPFYSELEDFDSGIATPLIRTKAVLRKGSNTSVHKIASNIAPISNPRKRRRESSRDPGEVLIPRSPQLTAEEASRLFGSSPVSLSGPAEDAHPSLPKITRPTTSRSSGTSAPEVWSDTMAPPQSSPSETMSESKEHHISPKAKSSRRKALPSPTSSKKALPRTRAQSSRALEAISTAQLQNLLPLRRDKNQSRKDDSFSMADADPNNSDEASFVPKKRTRAPTKQPKTPTQPIKSKSKPKPTTLRDKTNTKKQPPPRSITIKPASAIKPTTLTSRTYTRCSRVASGQENPRDTFALPLSQTQEEPSSDTENQDHSSTTIADLDTKSKHELEAIIQKFAEVDEWEMEFEEADESSGTGDVLLLGA